MSTIHKTTYWTFYVLIGVIYVLLASANVALSNTPFPSDDLRCMLTPPDPACEQLTSSEPAPPLSSDDLQCQLPPPAPGCPQTATPANEPVTSQPPPTSEPATNPTPSQSQGGKIINPLKAQNFGQLVENFANLATTVAIPFVVVFLMWAGFLFVSARGNPQQLTKAKETFYWTIIGAAVVVGASALAKAVVDFAQSL